MVLMTSPLKIGSRVFKSRLFLGTGKFGSAKSMQAALEASGAELVTVAVKRVNLKEAKDPFVCLLDYIDSDRYLILANTAGALKAEEAVRLARLAEAAGLPKWIKLEIHPDPHYLLPDPIETFKAAGLLLEEGWTVLPYINADPVLAARLQDLGCAAVMPLASPIGSHQGLRTRSQLSIIIEQARVPVVVDAGLGSPSDAAAALELGADAVLVNSAIAVSKQPSVMAEAFALATLAGRRAYEVGLAAPRKRGSATSPLTAFLNKT